MKLNVMVWVADELLYHSIFPSALGLNRNFWSDQFMSPKLHSKGPLQPSSFLLPVKAKWSSLAGLKGYLTLCFQTSVLSRPWHNSLPYPTLHTQIRVFNNLCFLLIIHWFTACKLFEALYCWFESLNLPWAESGCFLCLLSSSPSVMSFAFFF